MSEDPQFNLETDVLAPDPELESEPPTAPVVVIQYRNRGIPPFLLFPATLVLSLGMFAAYHYLFVAPEQRELRDEARAQAASLSPGPGVADESKPESTSASKEPDKGPIALSLGGQPLPPGFRISLPPPNFKDSDAIRVVAKPVDAPGSESSIWDELNGKPADPSTTKSAAPAAVVQPTPAPTPATEPRKEPAAPLAIGFAPPSDAPKIEPPKEVALGPKPAPPRDVVEPAAGEKAEEKAVNVAPVEVPVVKPTPTHEEMMRGLEAEAEAKRAARAEQARAKDQAIARVEIEALDRVESERALFHDELKRIVGAGGPTSAAGQEIDELCDKFGRTYSGDLKAQVLGSLARFHGKVSRDNEIRMLRSLGVPEPGILDYLANNVSRSINSRNGPHTPDAVRVTAAKQLLRAKLLMNPAMGAPTPAGPARARQPQAARGAISRPAR